VKHRRHALVNSACAASVGACSMCEACQHVGLIYLTGQASVHALHLGHQDAEESAGNVTGSVVEPLRVLGDASVICRDPSAMHLLAAAAIQVGRGSGVVQLCPGYTQQR
jgi:hypothetical protein